MRKIGLVGGVGWRSTEIYYRLLNQEVALRRGGLSSARVAVESLDFAEVRALVDTGREDALRDLYLRAVQALVAGGAVLLALCSNSAHARLQYLQESAAVRFLHIADPVNRAIVAGNFRKILLLGTREVMERDFMKTALSPSGATFIVPGSEEREWLHRMIFEDLETGNATCQHRQQLVDLVNRYATAGADGVILGCTELSLLISDGDARIPCLDTTRLHATALVDAALES